jgi:hypothetical protein
LSWQPETQLQRTKSNCSARNPIAAHEIQLQRTKSNIVPDGKVNLLPFDALKDIRQIAQTLGPVVGNACRLIREQFPI